MCIEIICITVNYPNIPIYLKWVYWINHMTYLVSAMLSLTFEDKECERSSTGIEVCLYIYIEEINQRNMQNIKKYA